MLPCGTGKTRVALRITERLTHPGELSVVLCPSIALVAQIRREFLQHASTPLKSDGGVFRTRGSLTTRRRLRTPMTRPLIEEWRTTEEITGCPVTTDPEEIAGWIRNRKTVSAQGCGERNLRHLPVGATYL